jgi:hypothetical protein
MNDPSSSQVVDATLLAQRPFAFWAMLNAKRTRATNIIKKFFTTHVYPYSMKKIATKFCQNVALEEFSKMSFEMLSSVLKKESVLDSTNDMLVRIIHLANWHRFDHPLISGNVDVKILLCAYMVTTRPTRVFTILDDLAKNVVFGAIPMLRCLHKTATALAEGASWPEVSKAMDKPLTTLLCAYLKAFKVNQPHTSNSPQSESTTHLQPLNRIGRQWKKFAYVETSRRPSMTSKKRRMHSKT